MKVYRSIGLLWLAVLLAGGAAPTRAQQPGAASRKQLAYAFMGYYFQHMLSGSSRPYRLAVRRLPVVSPYADHFDLRSVLSAGFLTTNQFISWVRVDSLLAPADFAAMRAQLSAWRFMRSWSAGQLQAAGVAVLTHDHRLKTQRLFPDFDTYQVFPPLFSRDGQLALFYVEHYCGLDCGSGQVNLLQRQPDGRWKIVLGVPIFMS